MAGDAILRRRESCAEKQPDQIDERIMSCMVSRKGLMEDGGQRQRQTQ
jgi:hypothetical protein